MNASPPKPTVNDLDNAIAFLLARLDEELRISERIDAKARQVFAVCAAFFAGAQALAFASFAEYNVRTHEQVLLLSSALVATVALMVVAHRLIANEHLRPEGSFGADGIVKWFAQDEGESYVSRQLTLNLARVAQQRRENNGERVADYQAVLAAARWSLALAALESIVAIVVRL